MNRVLLKKISIPFTIIGIPIKGFYTPFVSIQSNTTCVFRARFGKNFYTSERPFNFDPTNIGVSIVKYVDMLLNELGYKGVGVEIMISCDNDVPTTSVFSVATIEIVKEVLGITARDYISMLRSIAPFDERVLGIDPGYVESLRCSHLFNSVCVVKGPNEIVKLGSSKIFIEKVKEVPCKNRECSSLEYPYDSYILSLFYKMLTHVTGLLAQTINANDKSGLNEIGKILGLCIAWESKAVKDYLGSELVYSDVSEAKPIMDYTTVKFYKIRLM